MSEKEITYKFPKTVGECLAKLAKLQNTVDKINLKLAPLEKEESALREHMIQNFKKDKLDGARGSGRSLSITSTEVPVLKDWKKFFRFASKKGNDDLLARSVHSTAWRERVEAGRAVPGVESFTRVGLRVNRIKKEK